EDFSEAHDLAAKYPEKLKELQALFEIEARRNDIYPLGNLVNKEIQWYDVLSPVARRREFVYYAGVPRLTGSAVPDLSQSHRVAAEVTMPNRGAEGVILADGSRYGGFALYVKNGRLVFESDAFGSDPQLLSSSKTIPSGNVTLA